MIDVEMFERPSRTHLLQNGLSSHAHLRWTASPYLMTRARRQRACLQCVSYIINIKVAPEESVKKDAQTPAQCAVLSSDA